MNLSNKIHKNNNEIDNDEKKFESNNIFSMLKFKPCKFESNDLACCVVSPTNDNEPTLSINIDACDVLSKHFANIISLVGPPGVGKSTLSSTMYNVMRGDKEHYFEISEKSMMSFTKGIWALNEKTKHSKLSKDKIDVLDLEGIDDEDVIHYMVVVAMALSKCILLCANYSQNPRFQMSMFKTLETGFKLFKEYDIRLPKSIIYIQVPFGEEKFGIGRNMVDKNGLFAEIKKKYPMLMDFEMRTFGLPSFEKSNRLCKEYTDAVLNLINEISTIPEGPIVKQRMQYSIMVTNALNNNSPKMVSDMNFTMFEKELDKRVNQMKSNALENIKTRFQTIKLIQQCTYEEFIIKGCPDDGMWSIGGNIIEAAKNLSYYNEKDARHNVIIEKYTKQASFIDCRPHCEDDFKNALNRLKCDNIAKGNKLMQTYNESYQSTVDLKISEYVSKIPFYGSLYMPHQFRCEINDEKFKLKNKLIENTQQMMDVPDKFLEELDIDILWESAVKRLKTNWNTKIENAKVQPRKVDTEGSEEDHTCASCRTKHCKGVGHKTCRQNALWLWVDGATGYCVCDTCGEMSILTSVCCWNCYKQLNARIVTLK